jgi:Tfp pilus assembly protein PilN
MRPVNLIPQEQRIDAPKSMRSGPTAYILVGALVAALLGVTALVVTGNQVDQLNGEIAQVQEDIAAEEAEAQRLTAYTEFHSVREQRVATVISLADSRFDWERVMRELALILPGDVWLTNLTATANPGVSPGSAASVQLRGGIAGPALELVGCARGQEGVAGFVQALKDIDGVTRVGVQASALVGGEGTESGSVAGAGCEERDFLAQFQMAVAFDAAPIAATGSESESLPEVPASSPESESAAEPEGAAE